MTPDFVKASYKNAMAKVGETVRVRRYTGVGVTKPMFEVSVKARVVGYQPDELVGGVIQGDRKVILLVQDLIDAQWPGGTLKASDKIVVREKELAILSPDDSTRRIGNVLIAYEFTARG